MEARELLGVFLESHHFPPIPVGLFYAMAPIAAIAGVLVARYVPTSRDPSAPQLDLAGFALSTATA